MVDSGNIVSRSSVGTTSTRHLVVSLLETLYLSKVQSNFNGSNTFGTMKISSRQG